TNATLLTLAKQQQTVFENLLNDLFNKSIEGLHKTLYEVNKLQETHAWYHLNIVQILELRSKITEIQQRYD
ncbi:unnamed protein product, partial [Rotaria sp. Silwood2]